MANDDLAAWERHVSGGHVYDPNYVPPTPPVDPRITALNLEGETLQKLQNMQGGTDFLERMTAARERLAKVIAVEKGDFTAYANEMERTLKLSEKQLENELKHQRLLRGNRELESAIAEIREKGFKGASDTSMERINAARSELARLDALQNLGHEGQDAASRVLASTRARTRSKPGAFDIRGQFNELRDSAGGLDLTRPGSLLTLARANPVVAAAGVALSQRDFMDRGLTIPFVGAVPFSDVGNITREGQVTGEGARAGYAARGRAMAMGLNPFDMISRQVATAIVQGVRSRGFRGELGRAFEETTRNAVADLGLDPDQVMAMGDPFFRLNRGGEFTALIEDLDDLAKSTNQSIKDVSTLYQQLQDQFTSTGGLNMSPFASGVTEAIAKIPGLKPEQRAAAAQAFPAILSRLSGMSSTFTQTKAGAQAAMPYAQQAVERYAQQGRATGGGKITDLYVSTMIAAGGPLEGFDFTTAKAILEDPTFFSNVATGAQKAAGKARGGDLAGKTLTAAQEAARAAARKVRGGGITGFLRDHTSLGILDGNRNDQQRAAQEAGLAELEEQLASRGITGSAARNILRLADTRGGLQSDAVRKALQTQLGKPAERNWEPQRVIVDINLKGDLPRYVTAMQRKEAAARGDMEPGRIP